MWSFVKTGGALASGLITRPIVSAAVAISRNVADRFAVVKAYGAVIGCSPCYWIMSRLRHLNRGSDRGKRCLIVFVTCSWASRQAEIGDFMPNDRLDDWK